MQIQSAERQIGATTQMYHEPTAHCIMDAKDGQISVLSFSPLTNSNIIYLLCLLYCYDCCSSFIFCPFVELFCLQPIPLALITLQLYY